MNFKGTHILSIEQFEKADLEKVFTVAKEMEKGVKNEDPKIAHLLENKILATLFYEPSTRTKLSFQSAGSRLGAHIISETSIQFSSMYKGETSYDTAQMVSRYANIIAMRHPDDYSVEKFSKGSLVPVINAGDGSHEHPTQALLDGYTILKEKGSLNNITISMIGDLKYGRTVHSLTKLLLHYDNVQFKFIAPDALQIPEYLKNLLIEKKATFMQSENLDEGITDTDIIYMTRIQKERFASEAEYMKYKGVYVLNKELLKKAKNDSIIMHPLPRIDEITTDVDSDKRAKYFEEAENGVYVRMALLALCLGKK